MLGQTGVAGRQVVGACAALVKGPFFDRPAGDGSGLGSPDMLRFCNEVCSAEGSPACT